MSVPPSISPAGPTLAQVLTQRMFSRPPHVFVDGDLIEALKRADAGELHAVAVDPEREQEFGPPAHKVDVRV